VGGHHIWKNAKKKFQNKNNIAPFPSYIFEQ
jgi:hypothetical protein